MGVNMGVHRKKFRNLATEEVVTNCVGHQQAIFSHRKSLRAGTPQGFDLGEVCFHLLRSRFAKILGNVGTPPTRGDLGKCDLACMR